MAQHKNSRILSKQIVSEYAIDMECITQSEFFLYTSHFPALKYLLSSDFINFSLGTCLGFISLVVNFACLHPNVF